MIAFDANYEKGNVVVLGLSFKTWLYTDNMQTQSFCGKCCADAEESERIKILIKSRK